MLLPPPPANVVSPCQVKVSNVVNSCLTEQEGNLSNIFHPFFFLLSKHHGTFLRFLRSIISHGHRFLSNVFLHLLFHLLLFGQSV